MARASVAAQRRRARSSSTDSRLVYFVLMVWTVTFRMQTILPIEGENWISYSGETPKLDSCRFSGSAEVSLLGAMEGMDRPSHRTQGGSHGQYNRPDSHV